MLKNSKKLEKKKIKLETLRNLGSLGVGMFALSFIYEENLLPPDVNKILENAFKGKLKNGNIPKK